MCILWFRLVQQQVFYILPRITPNSSPARLELVAETKVVYPYNYLEMIDAVFGKEDNTIEVCSGMIRKYGYTSCSTVDINPETNPDLVDDAQMLSSVPNNRFNRWLNWWYCKKSIYYS